MELAKVLQQRHARLRHVDQARPRLHRAVRILRVEVGDEAEGVARIVRTAVSRHECEDERCVGLGTTAFEVGSPKVDEPAQALVVVVYALNVGAQLALGISDVPRILLWGVWLEHVRLERSDFFFGQHRGIIPKKRGVGVSFARQ